MRSIYDEVDDESVRSMNVRQRQQLHEILGREPENGPGNGSLVPIAPARRNADVTNSQFDVDPAAKAILEQVEAACRDRDEALAEYEKAKPIADRASAKAHELWSDVRRHNARALRLREALAALKAAR